MRQYTWQRPSAQLYSMSSTTWIGNCNLKASRPPLILESGKGRHWGTRGGENALPGGVAMRQYRRAGLVRCVRGFGTFEWNGLLFGHLRSWLAAAVLYYNSATGYDREI